MDESANEVKNFGYKLVKDPGRNNDPLSLALQCYFIPANIMKIIKL